MADMKAESGQLPPGTNGSLLSLSSDPSTKGAIHLLVAVCVLAAACHAIWPQAVDQTTAIFLGLAAAVLVLPQVTRIQLPGGTIIEKLAAQQDALRVQVDDARRRVEDQQQLINQLVATAVSSTAFHHLAGVALLRRYEYQQNPTVLDFVRREFYYLKDRGFIGPPTFEFGEWLDGVNVAGQVVPTEIGRIYLRLRKDDIPKEWLRDDPELRRNLRVEAARELGLDVPNAG